MPMRLREMVERQSIEDAAISLNESIDKLLAHKDVDLGVLRDQARTLMRSLFLHTVS